MKIICAALATGALVLFAASANAADSAASLLVQARQAAGGDAWSRIGFVDLAGNEQYSGSSGVFRDIQDVKTGRFRHDDTKGFVHYGDVWDGRERWKQDLSGGVHPLDSDFMRAVSATDAWLARRGFLKPGAEGATLGAPEGRSDAGVAYDVISATPRGGQPIELWFDAKTLLLSRTSRAMTTYNETVRYGDYRSLDGAMLARRIVIDDGDPASVETLDVVSCKTGGAPPDGMLAKPQTARDWSIAGGATTVPIEFDGDVVVEAKLNGRGPFAFILDTGGHDIMTPEVAKALGLKPSGSGVSGGAGAGTVTQQYARVSRMDIGGMTMRDQVFSVIPLQYDTVERGPRPPLAGILGLELFERFAMRLDYRARTLSFVPLDKYVHSGAGIAIPLRFSSDIPLAKASLEGHAGDFALDVGNSGSLVVQARWAADEGLAERLKSGLETVSFGAGGISYNWASRVDLKIAGFDLPHIVGRYADDKKGAFSSRTEAGNIGNDVFANFALDFDYGRGQLWFEPVPGFVPRPYGRTGFGVFKTGPDAFEIVQVNQNTPAAEAGLQKGDTVTAVDGVPARAMSGWDFGRAVRPPPGTKLVLSVVHDGRPKTVTLTTRELLP